MAISELELRIEAKLGEILRYFWKLNKIRRLICRGGQSNKI